MLVVLEFLISSRRCCLPIITNGDLEFVKAMYKTLLVYFILEHGVVTEEIKSLVKGFKLFELILTHRI